MIQAKLPILVCCYGDFPEISLDNINKILTLAEDPSTLRLYVGMNACSTATTAGLRKLYDEGKIEALVECRENRNKDPMMRVLLEHVEEPYFLWFDDDSYPLIKGWDKKVFEWLEKSHPFDAAGFIHVTNRNTYDGYIDFLKMRPWFKSWSVIDEAAAKDKNLKTNSIFPTGGLWMGRTEYLRKHDYPDRDMVKKSDDMFLGELITQTGGVLKAMDGMWGTVFAINASPRRGTGERSDDGWKGLKLAGEQFDGLTIYPTAGMSNRLRNIITAIGLCQEYNVPLRVIWELSGTQVAGIDFANYWVLPKWVKYESCYTVRLMEFHDREKARGNLFHRIPKERLRGAYHNHWGFTILAHETLENEGLRRLTEGLRSNLVPLNAEWSAKVQNFADSNNIKNAIGIHMRSFEWLFGERKPEQIESLRNNFLSHIDKDSHYFLATDSKAVQDEMKRMLGDRCIIWKPITKDFLDRESVEDFEHGLMDFYILSKCRKVLGTKGSSFSHLTGLAAGNLEWIVGARDVKEWDG